MAELIVSATIDSESERHVFAYSASGLREMFVLVIFRCPSCGSTGQMDSWCAMHSAPMDCPGQALKVKREPVLVPHAEPESATTELYDWEPVALNSLGGGSDV